MPRFRLYLLLIVSGCELVQCQNSLLIQWSDGCIEYASATAGRQPTVTSISVVQTDNTSAACQTWCTGRTNCGLALLATNGKCSMYNINDDIVTDHLTPQWILPNSLITAWFNKNCSNDIGESDMACNDYNTTHENQHITFTWAITNANHIPNLTPEECQRWCTLYKACMSVGYEYSVGLSTGTCYLYKTTIPNLLGSGNGSDVKNYTANEHVIRATYDRNCPEVPTTTTTTPAPTTTTTTVATTTTTTEGSVDNPLCLHGDDNVIMHSGAIKQIKTIVPGDKVMSVSDSGEIIYDIVYLITHAAPTLKASFMTIETIRTNITLRVADGHLLIVDGKEKRADLVAMKDELLVYGNEGMSRDVVGAITRYEDQGVYSPVTEHGRLVVNGVLTSSYSDIYGGIIHPAYIHTLLWPMRVGYNFAMLADFINMGYNEESGQPLWIMFAQKLFEKYII